MNVNIEIPEMEDLQRQITELREMINDHYRYRQEWYTLQEACEIKGLNYNSLQGEYRKFQPNFGIPDSNLIGRRWRRETIIEWAKMSGEEIDDRFKQR